MRQVGEQPAWRRQCNPTPRIRYPCPIRDQLELDSGRLSTQRRAAARRWSWLFHRSIEGHRSIPNCYVTLDPRSDQVGHDATVPAAVDERRYVFHSSSLSRPCAACGTVGPTASPSSASKNTVAEIVKRHRADAGQRQMSFARDEPYHAAMAAVAARTRSCAHRAAHSRCPSVIPGKSVSSQLDGS